MIQVHKNFSKIPCGLSSKSASDLLDKMASDFETYKLIKDSEKSKVYHHESVVTDLLLIYNSKCAYCESKAFGVSPIEIDHYRPKGSKKKNDEGYYWLTFEWSNLLLSCKNCNTQKSTNFLLFDESKRVKSPSNDLNIETPLLINPEQENPNDYLVFCCDGKIDYKQKEIPKEQNKGYKTIDIIDLNRSLLWLEEESGRKHKIDCIFKKLQEQSAILCDLLRDLKTDNLDNKQLLERITELAYKIIFQEIYEFSLPTSEFSAFGKAIFDNFESFLRNNFYTKDLDESYLKIMTYSFEKFKLSNKK